MLLQSQRHELGLHIPVFLKYLFTALIMLSVFRRDLVSGLRSQVSGLRNGIKRAWGMELNIGGRVGLDSAELVAGRADRSEAGTEARPTLKIPNCPET